MSEVKKKSKEEGLSVAEYHIEHASDKFKECKHKWRDLEQLSATYKAENGFMKPATFQFCNKCRIIRIGGEIL